MTNRNLVALALAAALLAGCEAVVIGSFVSGTMAASDRRTVGTQVEDAGIVLKAGTRISDRFGDKAHVNVNCYNRKILLTGEAASEQDKAAIEKLVGGVDNVRTVVNEIEVMGASSLSVRSGDAIITGKVKGSFVDARDIFASSFKVVTERGTVYLMGRVTEREGKRAAEIARNIGGVQKVVKVFDYITEDELKNLSTVKAEEPPPEKPAAAGAKK